MKKNKKIFIAIVASISMFMFFSCNQTAKETKVVAEEVEAVVEEVVDDTEEVVEEVVVPVVEPKPAPFRAEKTISYTANKVLDDGKLTILFDLGIDGEKKQISKVTVSSVQQDTWIDSNTYKKGDSRTFYGYDIKVNEDGSFSHNLAYGRINGTVKSGKIVGTFIDEYNTSYSFTANPN